MMMEGEIERAMNLGRTTRAIERLEGHVVLCGYGRIGRILAKELHRKDQPFVVVDNDPDAIADAQSQGFLVRMGDANEEEVLISAGIERAKALVTALPSDAANVFLTLTARQLNGEVEIIARAEAPVNEKKLYRSGANRVVLPTAIGATKIANLITHPSAESLLADAAGREQLNEDLQLFGLKLQEFTVAAGSELVGRPLAEAESRGQGGVVIVAIRHLDGTMEISPSLELQLAAEDTIFVMGHGEQVLTIARKAGSDRGMMFRGARM